MTPVFSSAVQLLALLAGEVVVIVAVAWLLQKWVASAPWRRALWQIAVLSVLAITACELSGVGRGIAEKASRLSLRPRLSGATRVTAQGEGGLSANPAALDNPPIQMSALPANPTPQALPANRVESAPPGGFWGSRYGISELGIVGLVLTIWVVGGSLAAGRVLLAWCVFWVFLRRRASLAGSELSARIKEIAEALGMKRGVRVVQSARLTAPIAFGLARPAVALPVDFATRYDRAKQDAMLAHEVAHLAAWDPLWYRVADVAAAALWWHPAVWWMRRQLHDASESAADEASLLVADGPQVLAECLVELGGRLIRPRLVGALGVQGYRSNLGRRVERLLMLENSEWSPPQKLHTVLARSFMPMAMVVVVILITAWVAPQAKMKGNGMQTLKQHWNRSMAAAALLAAFHPMDRSLAADAAAAPTVAPASVKSDSPRLSSVVPTASDGQKHSAQIEAKLKKIILPEVMYDGLPLGEVVRNLIDESRKRDPDKEGVNFLVNPNSPPNFQGAVDPTTGLPVPAAVEAVDINSIIIRISPALRNVNMKEALDAIVTVADHPVQYALEDYGVVLSERQDIARPTAPQLAIPREALTYKVNTNAFVAGLQRAFGIQVKLPSTDDALGRSRAYQSALRDLLLKLGINADGKSIFYNELTGTVLFRGTEMDHQSFHAAMDALAPQSGAVLQSVIGSAITQTNRHLITGDSFDIEPIK